MVLFDLINTKDNTALDIAEQVIRVPDPKDVNIKDPEELMRRIDDITSPSGRIKELFLSLIDPFDYNSTHEADVIKFYAITGILGGLVYGGLIRETDLTASYTRRFNAATFDGKHHMRRHLTDTYFLDFFGRGTRWAIYGGLLTGSAATVSMSSIVYRNDLYYPDWAVGYSLLGAASRFWSLGVRGAIGGASFGLAAGTLLYLVSRANLALRGQSVAETKYLHYKEFAEKKKYERKLYRQAQEESALERIRKMS